MLSRSTSVDKFVCVSMHDHCGVSVGAITVTLYLKEGRGLHDMIYNSAEMNQEENVCFEHSQLSFILHLPPRGDLKQEAWKET